MIGCPFRTTYGAYISALRSGLERAAGSSVQWVATNCGCGDRSELARDFQVQDCDYFETRTRIGNFDVIGYSNSPIKRALKSPIRNAGNRYRVSRYAELGRGSDVVHMQQILHAYGSDVAFRLLRKDLDSARVITVHELDPQQVDFPESNKTYNLADAVIVHDSLMKKKLVSLGVEADLVHVVCHGADLAEGESVARDGIVFYGGHHLLKGKGLELLLQAYRLLKDRSPTPPPRLRIHGHFGMTTPPQALEWARQAGVADDVDWLNEVPLEEFADLYARSQLCVLPFTGSFAGLPVGAAAANRVPIIASRFAGIPDHIGDLGIWISGDDPVELADRMEQVLSDEALRQDYGSRLRAHAEQHLGWDAVARDTLTVYRAAYERASARLG
jgi:glycosyltransferase involved in cell wall biosynthesis